MQLMAASRRRSFTAACWAGLFLSLTACSSEQQASVLEAHRQTLLDTAQQLESAAARTEYFSKDFPHGSGAEVHRIMIEREGSPGLDCHVEQPMPLI